MLCTLFIGTKPQTYFKQRMTKLQSKLTSMITLSKLTQEKSEKREQEQKLQEEAVFNKNPETVTLPKITEYVVLVFLSCM